MWMGLTVAYIEAINGKRQSTVGLSLLKENRHWSTKTEIPMTVEL